MDWLTVFGVDVGKYATYASFLTLLDRDFLRDLILEEPLIAKEFTDVLVRVIGAARRQLKRTRKDAYLATLESLHKLILDEMKEAITSA